MIAKQKEILETNRLFHNQIAHRHDKVNSYISKNNCKKFYENLFLRIIGKSNMELKKANVLELGCGTGNFLGFLLTQNIDSYMGIDISEKMVDRAREKSLKPNSSSARISFYAKSAEDFIEEMQMKNKKFDVIFSFSFLHHLFDPKIFLHGLENILSPGGVYIALHEPNISARNEPDFSKYIDARAAYLFGYDTTDISVLLRIKKITSSFFRMLSRRMITSFNEENKAKVFDYVDYQLNFINFNTSKIIEDIASQNVRTYTESYNYFVFDFLKKICKPSNNYFYLVVKNKGNS